MITTYFNAADIDHACNIIRAKGEEPIIYTSQRMAREMIQILLDPSFTLKSSTSDTIIENEYNKGYIGYFYGAKVYVTDEVGDLYVIVPRYKEEKKK